MSTLILIRHGQSQWNLENRFTGWTDVPLTPQGEKDPALAGKALHDFTIDRAFTSKLVRAQETLRILLEAMNQTNIPIDRDSALNERHYGDLQGLDKAETAKKYGAEQVKLWRRSYDTRPPNGESMADCERRVMPFFNQYILPFLQKDETVIIAAHGNSLRPIMKWLDAMTPEAASSMEIFCSVPYIYTLEKGKVTGREVREVPGMVVKGTATIAAK